LLTFGAIRVERALTALDTTALLPHWVALGVVLESRIGRAAYGRTSYY
jgi:hypothetical protein